MVPHPVSVRLQEQQLHCVMWFCRSRYRDGLDMPACVCGRASYHSFNEWRHLLRPAVWKFVGWNYWNSSAVMLVAYSSMNQHSVVARDGAFNIVDKFLHQVQTSIDGWHLSPSRVETSHLYWLDEACSQFGLFVKLLCQTTEPALSTSTIAVRNAFDVLMRSQAALSQRGYLKKLRLVIKSRVLLTLVGSGRLQPPLSSFYHHSGLFYHHSQRIKSAEMLCLMQFDLSVTTTQIILGRTLKKDKLFNDLIDLFEEKGWTWVDSGNTLGKSFLWKLWDVLWYIDTVLANSLIPIPEIFNSFSGYNTSELNKHWKRKVVSMSYDILISHVGLLKECLITSWMQQDRWHALHKRSLMS